MKRNAVHELVGMMLIVCAAAYGAAPSRPGVAASVLTIANDGLTLGFDSQTGALCTLFDRESGYEWLDDRLSTASPWLIEYTSASGRASLDIRFAQSFSFTRPDPRTLVMEWRDFTAAENRTLRVRATVSLEEKRPLSSWRIALLGAENKRIEQVVFPRIARLKESGEERLAVPQWMGQLMKNPRIELAKSKSEVKKFEWTYPGIFSLQCLALYHPQSCGLYAACNDTSAFIKNFSIRLDTLHTLVYGLHHFPAYDSTLTDYAPAYAAQIGVFQGDWLTAAEWYRDWGGEQHWCRESRFATGRTPDWLDNTALWIWNRSRSNNVLIPAVDLQQRLGKPVNVFWHWWHNCLYDDGFPEYIPPREGVASFKAALDRAQRQGLHAMVYMNQVLWGMGTLSWQLENAALYSAKNQQGEILSHIFNIFTNQPLAYMCMATPFWRNKYASLCDSVFNRYQVDGVYMDMACLSLKCYDPTHGHPIGGGKYWVENFHKLVAQIRARAPEDRPVMLAGEGCGEAWLPYLDAFLTLAVSKERYAGPGLWETIPFFQAVYHPYAITYGNYSSLLTPPYDELWPKEYAPKEPLQMLDKDFNKQFLMEQARSFVWGLQPTIANYQPFLALERKQEIGYLLNLARTRSRGLKYLLHGRFVRAPEVACPEEELALSRLSIYAGKKGETVTRFSGRYPVVYAAAWQSKDQDLGIALTNIGDTAFRWHCTFPADRYALPTEGRVYLINPHGRRLLGRYSEGQIQLDYLLQPREACVLEMTGK
ncbi:MAG TPA: DUF6259 domain-containing protein [bacterium]|nr:DUF6259 domain-containing protein [bacterium]